MDYMTQFEDLRENYRNIKIAILNKVLLYTVVANTVSLLLGIIFDCLIIV